MAKSQVMTTTPKRAAEDAAGGAPYTEVDWMAGAFAALGWQ